MKDNFFITDLEKLVKTEIHDKGYKGKSSYKAYVVEADISDMHDETTSECVRQYAPNSNPIVKEFPTTNQHNFIIDLLDSLKIGEIGFINMSFHGWNPDRIAQFRHIQEYKEKFDIYDEFFNRFVINVAAGNNVLGMPANTKYWKDLCISWGAAEKKVLKGWVKSTFTMPSDKLDFLFPDTVNHLGESHRGTSFSSPKGMAIGMLIAEQLDQKGIKWSPTTIYYILRGMITDIYTPSFDNNSGFGLITPRLVKYVNTGNKLIPY